MPARAIAIDLDSTLTQQVGVPNTPPPDYIGELLPGAAEALREFKRQGFVIRIATGRVHHELPQAGRQRELIARFLQEHDVPFDSIEEKPWDTFVLIDDRAIHFIGNWALVVAQVAERIECPTT